MKLHHKPKKTKFRRLRILKRKQTLKLRRSMLALKVALSQEKVETREMLSIYNRYLQGESQPGEMKVANKQFVDIVKGLGIGVFAVLPFSPITIPLIVKLGKYVGVDILPSAFNGSPDNNKADQDKNK
jgi:hypothetical protein